MAVSIGVRDPFRSGDPYENDPIGGGGGRGRDPTDQVGPAQSAGIAVLAKRKAQPHSVLNNRRGLLLNAEQLAGPAAPNYLLRAPYVYGRQSLL